jgi:hypothetical protein
MATVAKREYQLIPPRIVMGLARAGTGIYTEGTAKQPVTASAAAEREVSVSTLRIATVSTNGDAAVCSAITAQNLPRLQRIGRRGLFAETADTLLRRQCGADRRRGNLRGHRTGMSRFEQQRHGNFRHDRPELHRVHTGNYYAIFSIDAQNCYCLRDRGRDRLVR